MFSRIVSDLEVFIEEKCAALPRSPLMVVNIIEYIFTVFVSRRVGYKRK